MKPITINITNLIGTMVIIGNEETASAQIQGNVIDALKKVLKAATEATFDPSRAESCNKASEGENLFKTINKELLQGIEVRQSELDRDKKQYEDLIARCGGRSRFL